MGAFSCTLEPVWNTLRQVPVSPWRKKIQNETVTSSNARLSSGNSSWVFLSSVADHWWPPGWWVRGGLTGGGAELQVFGALDDLILK